MPHSNSSIEMKEPEGNRIWNGNGYRVYRRKRREGMEGKTDARKDRGKERGRQRVEDTKRDEGSEGKVEREEDRKGMETERERGR